MTTNQASVLESAIPALAQLERLIADRQAVQRSALLNVLSELKHLELALAEDRSRQETLLKTLEADERLKRLATLAAEQRSEFDALDVIGQFRFGSGGYLWGFEEFHSNALAWLLDPSERHGFGDCFLKRFLRRAGVPQAAEAFDWSATDVIREWPHEVDGQGGFLDLLIVNESEQVLCAIENKTFSEEHDEQLTRYRQALEVSYSTFTKSYVFLTPWGTHPFREKERKHWKPLTYAVVYDTVQQIAENDKSSTNADVRAFLRQYATTLRRNLMSDTSIPELARRIYQEHRVAIELIIAHRPSRTDETKPLLKEVIERQSGWILDMESNTLVRFRSADWEKHEATQTGTSWAPESNALLLFEFSFATSGRPWLKLTLGRGDETNDRLRAKIFESIKTNPKLFRLKHTSLKDDWTVLHEDKDYMLDESDFGVGWDECATRAKLEAWVADFADTRFCEMNKVIVDCLREYEADQKASESG